MFAVCCVDEGHLGARASRPHPYSCKQPPIHQHSLETHTEPAFTGFHSIVRSFVREGSTGLGWSGEAAAQGDCGVGRRFFGEAMRSRTGASYSPHSRLGWARTHMTPGCHPGLQEAAKRRHRVIVAWGGVFLEKQCVPERVLPIRRISRLDWRGPIRPRVATRGYTRPQLRSSIRMARRWRLAGQPTSTAAFAALPEPTMVQGETCLFI